MPQVSERTGLTYPVGDDFNDTFPATFLQRFDPALQRAIKVECATTQERDDRYGRPGGGTYPVCQVRDEVHQWDGARWVVWDTQPKTWAPKWYTTNAADDAIIEMQVDPDASGGGGVQGWYYRMGHMIRWSALVERDTDSNVGQTGGYYVLTTPFVMQGTIIGGRSFHTGAGLSGMVTNGARLIPCAVGYRTSQSVFLAMMDGVRISATSVPWGENDTIAVGGLSRMGF